MKQRDGKNIWVVLRLAMGFVFLWSALDSIFGLGFPTEAGSGWIAGNSPTFGFLNFATYGPFSPMMQALAGNPVVDVLHVGGQLLIGLSLLAGIGLGVAGYAGALMMVLIYLARIPAEFNPIIDQHIMYALVLIGIAVVKPNYSLSLAKYWTGLDIVQKYPILGIDHFFLSR